MKLMSDAHHEAVAEANRVRAYGCNKCHQTWSLRNVPASELPPSAQDAVFPGQRYDYCSACGNLRMRRNTK